MVLEPTVENYAKVVEEFIKNFDINSYSIIAYSFGGTLAQVLLNNTEFKPDKIVYISTIHSGGGIYERWHRLFNLYFKIKMLPIPSYILKRTIKYFLFRRFGPTYSFKRYHNTKLFKEILNEDLKCHIQDLLFSITSLMKGEYLKEFKRKINSTMIVGDSDALYIKTESLEIANELAIEPIILNDCDHNHLFFALNKSSQLILAFLKGN